MRQTFLISFLLLMACSCQPQKPTKTDLKKQAEITLGLQPFSRFEKRMMDSLCITIQDIYGYRTVILPEREMPVRAYTDVKMPRYRADTLIRYLRTIKPDSIDLIMGLTDKDISTSKRAANGQIKQPRSKYEDWGIFGLANRPGRSSVISTFRYRDADYPLLINRFRKICVHELGHNLGLPHCKNEKCVMRDAEETIKTVDHDNLQLCDDCKKKMFYLNPVEYLNKINNEDLVSCNSINSQNRI